MRSTRGPIVAALAAAAILLGVAASPAAATTVIANKTIHNAVIARGAHDRIYDHVTFTGGGSTTAVLQIDRACHDITFRDCVISSGPWNGISINDERGDIHDITFLRCQVNAQKRMGFECTSRPSNGSRGYHGIRIMNCVFSPQGSEAISFDGGPACVNNRVSGTVVQGAGTNAAFAWGAGVECNGLRRFRFTGNTVYQCRGALLNLSMHTTKGCAWTFTGNRLNASVSKQTVPMKSDAQVICAKGVRGGEFHRNKITAAAPGGGVAWFGDCHRMDWRSNTWRDARRGSWDEPYEELGSSGNQF